ncbi:MAG: hypothetical protein HOK83_03410, partial [Rhodospirillaceae bacterium]|nr:hypothetical protein [Rhodospirillaceae bacterium]
HAWLPRLWRAGAVAPVGGRFALAAERHHWKFDMCHPGQGSMATVIRDFDQAK